MIRATFIFQASNHGTSIGSHRAIKLYNFMI